jgi:hypothetical protein
MSHLLACMQRSRFVSALSISTFSSLKSSFFRFTFSQFMHSVLVTVCPTNTSSISVGAAPAGRCGLCERADVPAADVPPDAPEGAAAAKLDPPPLWPSVRPLDRLGDVLTASAGCSAAAAGSDACGAAAAGAAPLTPSALAGEAARGVEECGVGVAESASRSRMVSLMRLSRNDNSSCASWCIGPWNDAFVC